MNPNFCSREAAVLDDQAAADRAYDLALDRADRVTPAVLERPSAPPPVGSGGAPRRPVCDECGTPYHAAAGPHGARLYPSCWCEDDKRKAQQGEAT